MAKFRGGSDDWFDDEKNVDGVVRKKNHNLKKKREALPQRKTTSNAVVTAVFPNLCQILGDQGESLLCSYRRVGVFGRDEFLKSDRQRAPVAVGDRVEVEALNATEGVVEGVEARKNRLIRHSPDREATLHVVAANVDILAIVTSARDPDFNPGIVDRFWVAALSQSIETVLVVNKMDLAPSDQHPWQIYIDLGLKIFEVSAKEGWHLSDLQAALTGKRVVFAGHSGVGKTSLIRKFLGTQVGAVGLVNEATGKGVHTTTGAQLWISPGNTQIVDTPGVREFDLYGVAAEDLRDFFTEFLPLACHKRGCLHLTEEDCEARNLQRHSSYMKIYESIVTR